MAPRCCCSRNNYVVEKDNGMILELYLCLRPQTQIGKSYSLCLPSYQLPSLLQKGGNCNNSHFTQGKLRTENKTRKVYCGGFFTLPSFCGHRLSIHIINYT